MSSNRLASRNVRTSRPCSAAAAFVLVSSLLAACGCGEGNTNPPTVKVRGTVSFKGKPLTNGTIQFNPSDAKTGRMGQAKIAEDGTFIPSTFKEHDGLLPGTYTVTVTSTEPGTEAMAKDKGTGVGGKSAIPEKYNDPKKSGLNETVGAGDANRVIALELKD